MKNIFVSISYNVIHADHFAREGVLHENLHKLAEGVSLDHASQLAEGVLGLTKIDGSIVSILEGYFHKI